MEVFIVYYAFGTSFVKIGLQDKICSLYSENLQIFYISWHKCNIGRMGGQSKDRYTGF